MVASTNNSQYFLPFKISRKMWWFLPFFICSVFVLPLESASTDKVNVITEIERAFAGNGEMDSVVQYLQQSKKELLQALTKHPNETDKSYTFFAPNDWAFVSIFISATPFNVSDPFSKSAELRKNVLLRHFFHGSLSKDDLPKLTELIMADEKPRTISINSKTGKVEINGAIVDLTPIPLRFNLGVVYVVNGVFTTHEEVNEAVLRLTNSGNRQNVESQTMVYGLSLLASLIYVAICN